MKKIFKGLVNDKRALAATIFIFFLIFLNNIKIKAQTGEETARLNQTSSINITGNASTAEQSTINSYLDVNGDGLTWDITEAQVGSSYTYPIANQNFTSDASGWYYVEENDVNNMATGSWDPDSGRIDPGSYNFTIIDTSARAIAIVNQTINYTFTINTLPTSAKTYAFFELTCTDDCLVYAKLQLRRPAGDIQDLWISSTYTTTATLDTGWLNVSVDATSNFTSTGEYRLILFVHSESDDAGANAAKPSLYHYLDDAGVELVYPTYGTSVEHNATISYGTLNSINASINFTSTLDDIYNMTIYNFANSNWEASSCQNQSVTANTYYTIWCNVTANPTNYISSNTIRVRLNSTVGTDVATLKEEYVQYYISYPTPDTNPPTYSLNSTNSTLAGTPIEFRLYWTDGVGLSKAITSLWNGSSWVNASSWCSLSGTSSWCNQTLVVNSTPQQLWWKQYANDTSNNWNVSENFSLVTSSYSYEYTILMPSGYTCTQDCWVITAQNEETANQTDQATFYTSETAPEVQPTRAGDLNKKQSGNLRPIILVNNTGSNVIDLFVKINETLPSTLALYLNSTCTACGSYEQTKIPITTTYQSVITGLQPGGYANISLWLDASQAAYAIYGRRIYLLGQ